MLYSISVRTWEARASVHVVDLAPMALGLGGQESLPIVALFRWALALG